MGNISLVLLLFFVAIIVFWIFENINEKFGNIDKDSEIAESPIVPKIKSIDSSNDFPIREEDLQTQYYINRKLSEQEGEGVRVSKICPRPVQSNNEFNKDFFAFRDKIEHNSSMMYDSVDRVNNMILDGGIDQKDMKIKDIYDQLTAGVDLYSKKCTRIPYFDNTMHDDYNYDFISGMHNVRDNWIYKHENEMNGGQLENNFYANDPSDLNRMPAL